MSAGHLFGPYAPLLPQAHISASCSTFVPKGSKAEVLVGVSHSFLTVTLTFTRNPPAVVYR